jgi:hypothetical protein
MARIVADRVLETSTTTGPGSYTLAGTINGYRTAGSVCANGDTFTYYAEDVDINGRPLGGWETGLGTWSTGNILARTTVYASSNAGAAVSWAAGIRRIALSFISNDWSVFNAKQEALVSGTNIKTVNSTSLLGSGDILITGGLANTAIKTANYTAAVNDLVRVNSAGGPFTVTLPSLPVDGDKVGIFDVTNSCNTNPVLFAAAGGKTIEFDTYVTIDVEGAFVVALYNAASTNWKIQITQTGNSTGGLASSPVNSWENYSYIATAGQTTFAATYNPGSLEVYSNGIRLDPSDYTATNGTSVVLAQACALDDVININSYSTFDIANTYSTGQLDTLFAGKQGTLVSGTNIKTIDGQSVLGPGDLTLSSVTLDSVQTLTNKTLVGVKETAVALAAGTIDCSLGNYFTKTISTATTFTVTNIGASGTVNSFILELTNGGTSVITWWSNVKWPGAAAPLLTTAGKDLLSFISVDGGLTWFGLVVGTDLK